MTDAAEGHAGGGTPLTPGWYDDPSGRFDLRYHNGFRWTGDVSHEGDRFVDPEPPARSAPSVPPSPAPSSPDAAPPRNPLGTAAMVVGIVSICLAWLPVLFVIGGVLAVLALTFGAVGRRRARERGLDANRAVLGLITGGIGLACVAVGVILTVVLYRAVDRWDNPAEHEVTLTSCDVTTDGTSDADGAWSATGNLRNVDSGRADFTVEVTVSRSDSGGSGPSETVELDGVEPGESVAFEIVGRQVISFDPVCDVSVHGPKPFGVDLSG